MAMVLTASAMLPLGTPLPLDLLRAELAAGAAVQVSGSPDLASLLELVPGSPLAGRPLLVLFLSAHCPFVKHIEAEVARLERDLPALQLLAISSNSLITHPQDGPEGLRAQAAAAGWGFPYLFDGEQRLARACRAACTPDPFLFAWDPAAGEHQLAYRGQLDGSRPGSSDPCDGRDLRAAVAALLDGAVPSAEQRPSIGCNIKWRPGEEPEWAR
jgi:hypothetical protein